LDSFGEAAEHGQDQESLERGMQVEGEGQARLIAHRGEGEDQRGRTAVRRKDGLVFKVQCQNAERPKAKQQNAKQPNAEFYNIERQNAERPSAKFCRRR
jgi:hypothetical protein